MPTYRWMNRLTTNMYMRWACLHLSTWVCKAIIQTRFSRFGKNWVAAFIEIKHGLLESVRWEASIGVLQFIGTWACYTHPNVYNYHDTLVGMMLWSVVSAVSGVRAALIHWNTTMTKVGPLTAWACCSVHAAAGKEVPVQDLWCQGHAQHAVYRVRGAPAYPVWWRPLQRNDKSAPQARGMLVMPQACPRTSLVSSLVLVMLFLGIDGACAYPA